jgi:hypothetical protein
MLSLNEQKTFDGLRPFSSAHVRSREQGAPIECAARLKALR